MLSFSLDWNCVIAVENDEPAAAGESALADAQRQDCANVALLATSASESLRDKSFPASYELFEDRVKRAGLDDLPVLPAPLVWSLSFYGSAYYVDPKKYRQVKSAIWTLLFPSVEEEPWHRLGTTAFRKIVRTPAMETWRNAWCDVHNLVTHIDPQRDVLVTTNTRGYQRHAERLGALGVAMVRPPREAAEMVRCRPDCH